MLRRDQFQERAERTVLLVEGCSVQVLADVSEVEHRDLEVGEDLHRDSTGLRDVRLEDEVVGNVSVGDVDLGLNEVVSRSNSTPTDLFEQDGLVGEESAPHVVHNLSRRGLGPSEVGLREGDVDRFVAEALVQCLLAAKVDSSIGAAQKSAI